MTVGQRLVLTLVIILVVTLSRRSGTSIQAIDELLGEDQPEGCASRRRAGGSRGESRAHRRLGRRGGGRGAII